jgi:hypothetical protein
MQRTGSSGKLIQQSTASFDDAAPTNRQGGEYFC